MRPIFEGETALDLTRSTCDVGDAIEVRYSSNNRSRKAKFGFDRVFDGECLQEVVFDEVRELVTSAMDGHNVSLFCYGPTGTGKTHTLTGPAGSSYVTTPNLSSRWLSWLTAACSQNER